MPGDAIPPSVMVPCNDPSDNQGENFKYSVFESGIHLSEEDTLSKDIYKCVCTPTIIGVYHSQS